jgi:CheY-like chemotaxis protein
MTPSPRLVTLTQFAAKQKGQRRCQAGIDRRRVRRFTDTVSASDMLTTFLHACGAGVLQARNAAAALAYVDTQQHIDVIISDISMPRVDGVELVRRVRERRPSLPAIALTGFYEDYMDTRTAGFAAFLRKPVNLDELCRAIRNAVRSR